MIKMEERKLKEEDIKKLRERQKRLNEQKKNEIIEKVTTSNNFFNEIK